MPRCYCIVIVSSQLLSVTGSKDLTVIQVIHDIRVTGDDTSDGKDTHLVVIRYNEEQCQILDGGQCRITKKEQGIYKVEVKGIWWYVECYVWSTNTSSLFNLSSCIFLFNVTLAFPGVPNTKHFKYEY